MKSSKDRGVISAPTKVDPLFPISQESSLEELVSRIRGHLGRDNNSHQFQKDSANSNAPDSVRSVDNASMLSMEEVIRRVRTEVDRRRNANDVNAVPVVDSDLVGDNRAIPRWEPLTPRLPVSREYVLGDLLKFADAEFIDTAYQVILRRPADPAGRHHYLTALRSSDLSKVEILGLIRFSPEGMRLGTHIDGLLLPYKLHQWTRIRFFGPVLSFAMAVFRLPTLAKRLVSIETIAAAESQAIGHLQNRISGVIEEHFDRSEQSLKNLNALADQLETLIFRVEALQHVSAKLETLESALELHKVELHSHRVQREQREHDLLQRFDEQFGEVARLKLQMQEQKEEREKCEKDVFQKLSEQASIAGSLAENIGSFKALYEQSEQSILLRVGELDSSISDLKGELRNQSARRDRHELEIEQRIGEQQAAMAYLSVELRAHNSERDVHDQEIMNRLSEHDSAMVHLGSELEATKSEHVQRGEELARQASERATAEANLFAELSACKTEFEQHAKEIERRLEEQRSASDDLVKNNSYNRRGLLDVERKLMSYMDKASTQIPGIGVSGNIDRTSAGDEILDAQYVAFEDKFRGERADIKMRAAHYLGDLAAANIGSNSGIVLDLGCGRGEWLEVLTEQGFSCRGVDLNGVMLEDSLARGFDVVEADAVDYLRGLADNSLAAITSMHLVEHLSHNVLIRLLDEALRVLQPGGVLILETPNPENITVGSCWFYLDPTHRNPIPPALLQWTVEERGFEHPAIERLSENRGVPDMVSVSEDVPGGSQINQLIEWFIAPPDYAVIATKPNLDEKPVLTDDSIDA